jgi:hypothetical protein
MGYKDKTKEEASLMRNKEEEAIELYRLNWLFHVKQLQTIQVVHALFHVKHN